MNFNADWTRWCFASFSKFFDSKKGSTYLYVDGTDRATANLSDFSEFRMDGPRIKVLGKHLVKLEVTVNILVQATMNDTDIHQFQRTIGVMVAAFEQSISAYRYGTGVNDNDTLFACFQRVSETGSKVGFDVRVNNFGIIDPTVRKQQATIEARYAAEITV